MAFLPVGRVEEFKESQEDFGNYIERLEQWMLANDIEDGKKVCVFLSVIGPETYKLLKNLISPQIPSGETYARLKEVLMAHYMPKPLVIAERFRFKRTVQKEGQTVNDYAVALRQSSADCDFGAFLNDALRDQFVSGLCSEATQLKLLSQENLTYQRALELALQMEMASKNTKEISGKVTETQQVHAVNEGKSFPRRGKGQFKKQFPKQERNGQNKQEDAGQQACYRCKGKHWARDCRFKNEKCHSCSKIGHISRACRSKMADKAQAQYVDEKEEDGESELLGEYAVYTASTSKKGLMVDVALEGQEMSMHLDTGAAVSLLSEVGYRKALSHLPLKRTKLQLTTYSGEPIPVVGVTSVAVQYGEQRASLPLVVVKGDRPALFGRNWLEKIDLNWSSIFTVAKGSDTDAAVKAVLERHKGVFEEGPGVIKDFKAVIRTSPEAHPIFQKARPVPYALKEKVDKELDRLEQTNIVSKVERSQWASPVVIVPKSDGSVRLCGDYKVTINQSLEEETYPLPNAEDLFATLAGGTSFSKLDLSHAYQQLQLDAGSEQYLTVNTHRGLYRYHRLSYGVASAPSIFQSVMDQILQGLEHVTCFLDDILITARTKEEHLQRLEEVLTRLERYNVKVKLSKCKFFQSSVEYLGHRIDKEGLHPTDEKVAAIVKAPKPNNVTELKSFLGLLNYYGKFLPNLSSLLQPIHKLLRDNEKWSWTTECDAAFDKAKQLLLKSKVLVHYDTTRPLKLACDASPYGVGAVISHIMDNGEEQPIAFASRTLSNAEKNYAQIEKEALAIIYGVKKFHKYLYGRRFTLITDHKPLLAILGPKSSVPTLAALRMQRWAIILMAYNYSIEYRRSADHSNADALSRLPQQGADRTAEEANVFFFSVVPELPVVAKDIEQATRKNPLLSKVWSYTVNGWPNYVSDPSLTPYFTRRHELSAEQGCLLWGLRVIIPPQYRERILDDLHQEHPGMCRMKSLARGHVWWPGLDAEIENRVRSCRVCQAVQKTPAVAPLHPWRWPERVWQRIHIDFAEKDKQYFLVLVDSHSKWLEVKHMSSITSANTIEVLRDLFANYGLPEECVSDNGPQLTSAEFARFMKENGVKHTLVPAFHPASNGAAERSVQILKRALLKQVLEGDTGTVSLKRRLANFLLTYRTTPHTVTGRTPAELFLKRQLRTRLSLLRPNLAETVENQQAKQKHNHDHGTLQLREFTEGERVRIKNFRGGKEKWTLATVIQRKGPVTYLIQDGLRKRTVHIDHMLPWRGTEQEEEPPPIQVEVPRHLISFREETPQPKTPPRLVQPDRAISGSPGEKNAPETETVPQASPFVPKSIPALPAGRRNPERTRMAPKRLNL